uniref:Uncharacterized protein n=1 Tax=Rhizophora mucronata TaxID=61149 RepID=A0A2P2PDY4_RHIMU
MFSYLDFRPSILLPSVLFESV